MSFKCFSIDDAINVPMDTKTVFIIANERTTKKGHIGRYYMVFPSFKFFLKNRNKYKHCHEILIDHKNNETNCAGRLVFDFDIKTSETGLNGLPKKIPDNFKEIIENTVYEVIEKYFNNVDSDKFVFVWSTSSNPNKFSIRNKFNHFIF